jgi:hypothetical protein
MDWTVLAFNDELLATSDQPVTVMPLLAPDRSAPVTPLPPGALIDCEEMRIATSPRQALVLTWLDEPDDLPPRHGTDALAAQLNRAVISQADQEWFHHPARRPTTLIPPLLASTGCAPVGRLLYSHYNSRYAERSPPSRRHSRKSRAHDRGRHLQRDTRRERRPHRRVATHLASPLHLVQMRARSVGSVAVGRWSCRGRSAGPYV